MIIDVRCPYPGHRWQRGDPGPCGLKLGELRLNTGGSVRLHALSILLGEGDGLYRLLRKPMKSKAAALRSTTDVDSIPVPAGGDIRLRCPQCDTVSPLSKLTTNRPRA